VTVRAFCADGDLRYESSRHRFVPGEGFTLSEDYRLAHLPLIDPAHPKIIPAVPGKDYDRGYYAAPRHALAVHVAAETLEASAVFRELDADLRTRAVAKKIAWATQAKRRDVLHATIAGPVDAPAADAYLRVGKAWLARSGNAAIRLGGPFVGNRNHGRIYLPVFPEKRDGADMYADLQRAVGARASGFFAIGLWHLADDLDAAEAASLAAWLDRWGDETVAILDDPRLGVLTTRDDQAIHSPVWRWIESAGGR
jgi:hypothetical protein